MGRKLIAKQFDTSFLQTLLDRAPALIVIYTIRSGEYIFVNDALSKLLGYKPREFLRGGLPFVTSLLHPDDRERVMQENAKALERVNKSSRKKQRDPIVTFEYRLRHKNGKYRWLHTDGVVFSRGVDKKVECVMNISVDITARKEAELEAFKKQKKAEQKIIESEQRYRSLIEKSSDGISLLSRTGKLLYISPSAQRMFGYPTQDLRKLKPFTFIHPDDRKRATKAFLTLLFSPRKEVRTQYRVRCYDGTYKWLEGVAMNMLHDPSVKAIVTNFRDITDLMRQQEQLERAVSELRNIKYALDQSSIVAVTDKHGIISYVNDKFVEISKYPRSELVGKTHRVINSKYHSNEFFKNFWETITSGKVWRGEIRNRAKDGSYYWVDTTVTPLINKDGVPEQFIAIRSDITHRKSLEQQKDDFISIASHELKTPVTSLKVYVQILKRRLARSEDKEISAFFSKMESQVNKLTLLIRDLLDATKMQAGQFPLTKESFSLLDLVKEVVEIIQETSKNHRFLIKGGAGQPIIGDRERLGQVIVNLITNAIKYSPNADKIIIRLKSNRNNITLSVRDFGIGIEKAHQDRIFERFYRVSESIEKTFPGFGIGLYFSDQIVRRHGGWMEVVSEKGKGSTFSFTLPYVPENDTPSLLTTT